MSGARDAAAKITLLAAARAVGGEQGDDAEQVVAGALDRMNALQKRNAQLIVARTHIFCQSVIERATELAAGGEVTREHIRQAAGARLTDGLRRLTRRLTGD